MMMRASLVCLWLIVGAACSDEGKLANVRPEMVLIPSAGTALELGEVVVGETEVDPAIVRVENHGDFDLLLEDVAVDAPFRVSSSPERVIAGGQGEIFVRFEPTAPGTFDATLRLSSNDPDLPTAEYPARGQARERCRLSMAPTHQVFTVGEIKEVTIAALGTRDCVITSIQLDPVLFAIVDPPELPLTLAAGAETTLSVQHIAQSRMPGTPTRELRVKESEGTEVAVTLEGEPPLQDCLSVFPTDQLLFDTTPVGQIARASVEVSNRCPEDAEILKAQIGTGESFMVETSGYPLPVPALGSVSIVVLYDPFSELGDRGVLNIDTNDAGLARASIELFGQASKPVISVFPAQVDFGHVILRNPMGVPPRSECGSPIGYVQIYSVGDAELRITRLEIERGSDDLFSVSDVLVDGRPVTTSTIVIPPNKEGRINLRFSPSRLSPAEHKGALLIHHNAVGSPTRILLGGTATDDTPTTETFTQLDGPRLDVLFVVQNTFVSEDEQAMLIGQVQSFITTAEAANADYQMAVTVTDSRSSNAGKFHRCFPDPAITRSSYADQATRIAELQCTLDVGINGTFFYVSGLGAAKRAIERALDPTDQDPNTNPNAGFIRPDAKLMIIVLATRDDDSVESNALLRDYFLSVKGAHRPDRMVVHALAGPVLGPCPNERPFFVQPGYRYFWMTRETNGLFYSACEEDWAPFFDQIGLDVFSPIDEWDLSGRRRSGHAGRHGRRHRRPRGSPRRLYVRAAQQLGEVPRQRAPPARPGGGAHVSGPLPSLSFLKHRRSAMSPPGRAQGAPCPVSSPSPCLSSSRPAPTRPPTTSSIRPLTPAACQTPRRCRRWAAQPAWSSPAAPCSTAAAPISGPWWSRAIASVRWSSARSRSSQAR